MRNRTIPTLLAIELAEDALAGFYHYGLRIRVLEAFRIEGTTVPSITAIALSPWLAPMAVLLGAGVSALALLLPIRRSRKQWTLGTAVALVGAAFAFAVFFAVLPIFRPE